jgi:putative transposase
MRYPACEKLAIIQLVEHSHLPVRRTLVKLGIPRATFYRWYDLYRTGGPDASGDRSPRTRLVFQSRALDDLRGDEGQGADLRNLVVVAVGTCSFMAILSRRL